MATKQEAATAQAPAKIQQKIYELIPSGNRVTFFRKFADGSTMPVVNHDDFALHSTYTFTDEDGISRTTRFLKAANTIWREEQIKLGFPANIKIGEADRSPIRFKGSKLITSTRNVQEFCDNCPSNEAFKGDRGAYPVLFREFKPEIAQKRNSDLALRQAKCILALEEMAPDEMDSKLLKINGSAYTLPADNNDKKEALLDLINELDYDSLNIILEKKEAAEDTIEVIIGKAINQKVLSFIHAPGEISIKRSGGDFVKLLKVSEDHNEEQKIALFIDTLRTEEGQITLNAIKEALK